MSYQAIAQQLIDLGRALGFVPTVSDDVPVRMEGVRDEIDEPISRGWSYWAPKCEGLA